MGKVIWALFLLFWFVWILVDSGSFATAVFAVFFFMAIKWVITETFKPWNTKLFK